MSSLQIFTKWIHLYNKHPNKEMEYLPAPWRCSHEKNSQRYYLDWRKNKYLLWDIEEKLLKFWNY